MANKPKDNANGNPTKRNVRVITPTEQRILEGVNRFHALTDTLIGWYAGYAPASARRVQKLISGLVAADLLLRIPLHGRPGRPRSAYCLTRRSYNLLRDLGVAVPQRYRLIEQREQAYITLIHTLELNALLIGTERGCTDRNGVTLHTLRHERDLRGQAAAVTLRGGVQTTVCADAWLDFRIGTEQFPLAIEYDRNTEHRGKWTARAEALLAWARTSYAEQFGTPFLTIAVLAGGGGAPRRDTLRRWTEQVLDDLGDRTAADIFRFAALPERPTTRDLEQLVFTPCWFAPFSTVPEPLVPTGERNGS